MYTVPYFIESFFKDDDWSGGTNDDQRLSGQKSKDNATDWRSKQHLSHSHQLIGLRAYNQATHEYAFSISHLPATNEATHEYAFSISHLPATNQATHEYAITISQRRSQEFDLGGYKC